MSCCWAGGDGSSKGRGPNPSTTPAGSGEVWIGYGEEFLRGGGGQALGWAALGQGWSPHPWRWGTQRADVALRDVLEQQDLEGLLDG